MRDERDELHRKRRLPIADTFFADYFTKIGVNLGKNAFPLLVFYREKTLASR